MDHSLILSTFSTSKINCPNSLPPGETHRFLWLLDGMRRSRRSKTLGGNNISAPIIPIPKQTRGPVGNCFFQHYLKSHNSSHSSNDSRKMHHKAIHGPKSSKMLKDWGKGIGIKAPVKIYGPERTLNIWEMYGSVWMFCKH